MASARSVAPSADRASVGEFVRRARARRGWGLWRHVAGAGRARTSITRLSGSSSDRDELRGRQQPRHEAALVAAEDLDDEPRDGVDGHVDPERPAGERAAPLSKAEQRERGSAIRRPTRRAASGAAARRAACRTATASGLVNVTAHGTCVSRPKQQPAKKQPMRPTTCARARCPGRTGRTSSTTGSLYFRMHQMPTATASDQPAVEDAARPHQREDLAGVLDEVLEVDEDQQGLGADERRDDDPDAEVHHLVADPGRRGRARTIASCRPARYAAASSSAVGVDRDRARVQTASGTWRGPRMMSRMSAMAPIVMAASATLNAQKCQPA